MKPPNLGVYLVENAADLDACKAVCREVIADLSSAPYEWGKAATWLAYRALEGGGEEEMEASKLGLQRALNGMELEMDQFRRVRWDCSMRMILAYLQIRLGEDARETLQSMKQFNWLAVNPPCAVNMCRALALLAAAEAKAGRFRASQWAIEACQEAFRFASARMRLLNVANCAGHEIVLCAKAVHVTVALLPHCHQPFQGDSYGEAVILAIDQSEPFNGALRAVLPPSCFPPPIVEAVAAPTVAA